MGCLRHCQGAAGQRHRGGEGRLDERRRAAVEQRLAGHDLELPLGEDRMLRIECKAPADGFRQHYDWLNQRDVLVVKADYQEPLVIVRLSLAAEIAKAGAG
jgi:hypothetical protein